MAFGDSMTAGTTSPALPMFRLDAGIPQSYPFKLETAFAGRYTAQTISVYNCGKPAERATAGRDRFNENMSEAQPDIILLMDGANDLLALTGEDSDAAIDNALRRATDALEDMVRDATARGIPVLLATLPPQRASGSRGGGAAFVSRYNDGLKAMAAKKGAGIVDLYAEVALSFVGQDGLHLTEDGNGRLADVFGAALIERYEDKN